MSQSSCFKSQPDPVKLWEVKGETGDLGKRLQWRDRDKTWWEEYAQVLIYVIEHNRTGSALFGGGGGEGFKCFGEFGASGRAKTMKIGRRVRYLHKLT